MSPTDADLLIERAAIVAEGCHVSREVAEVLAKEQMQAACEHTYGMKFRLGRGWECGRCHVAMED